MTQTLPTPVPADTRDLIGRNRRFLTNIFRKGPFQGHALVCHTTTLAFDWTKGDHTLGHLNLDEWAAQVAEAYEVEVRELAQVGDDRVPAAKLWTGTQIYAHAFGCEVSIHPDSPPAAKPLVLTAEEADRIQEPDLWSCPNIVRIFELGRKLRARLGPDVPLSPPDCQSGFDIASQIWDKSRLFCSLIDEREAVHRLAAKCARFFKRVHLELRKEFPTLHPNHCPGNWVPPEMGVWVSNDECGIMSNKMFQEFMLPELQDLAATFGGLGMHCCAAAEHQFPLFKKIPNFYAFNRVPAQKGVEPILEHFAGPDAPVHCLAWLAEETQERLMREAAPGTRFVFNFFGDVESQKRALERFRKTSPRQDEGAEVCDGHSGHMGR